MATKAWSAKNSVIRDADTQTVKRWVPNAGFSPEGSIIQTEAVASKKPAGNNKSSVGTRDEKAATGDSAITTQPESSGKNEATLTPVEEALVSVAALRLLPDELESVRQQAFKEGDAEGHKRGYQEGVVAGKAQAEETFEARFTEFLEPRLKEAQIPLIKMLDTIQEEIPKLDAVLAEQILDLALILAQQMTCRAIQFNPKIILAILDEAIHALPREARGWLQIYVHPDDAAMLREAMDGHLNTEEHRVIEDTHIQKGGCRLVSRMGELDATLETRWKTLLKNLGRDDAWLQLDIGNQEVATLPKKTRTKKKAEE